MTYSELLAITAEKKKKAIREMNSALRGKAGWLVEAEIKRNPGMVAWLWLAKEFCETLAENFDEIYSAADEGDRWEISDIYMGYEDDSEDLYDILPVEAQLFTE